MKVTANMNLGELAEYMGSVATDEDAEQMRMLLLAAGYEDQDIGDIPESTWLRLLNQAVTATE